MKSYHPAPFIQVDIGHRDWIRLGAASLTGKPEWQIVEEAIDEWMRRHDPIHCGEPEFAGYQWKGLFLPDGTVLRTVFKGKNHHCRVEGDQILYEGQARSPSGFVNAVGGVRRNAWKSVWLLLPDSKHWQLADRLRARRHPVAPRRAAQAARPVKVPPAPSAPAKAPAAPSVCAAPAAPSVRAAPSSARAPTPVAPASPPTSERSALFAPPLASRYRWTMRPASP